MSQSVYPEASSAFVDEIISLDRDIASRMRFDRENVNEICQTYFERILLFEKSCILLVSEDNKMILQSIKEDLYLELKLYNLKQNLKTQLDEIESGLDILDKN